MIRNVILDWSGTLVDDLPAVWQATNHVFRQAGLSEMSLDQFRAEFCLPFKKFYERIAPRLPMAQLEDWFHSHFIQSQNSVSELPHAREFLDYCRQRKARLFVLSTVHPDHFATQCALTRFGEYFEATCVGVPDKQVRLPELLREYRLRPVETLFIGDMQHDVDAAKSAGVFSCAVLSGYSGLQQLRASAPDVIVEHLGELRSILEQHEWDWNQALAGEPSRSAERPVATVGAVVLNSAGQVLMLRTHKWSNLWGIPGGKIRFGETSTQALVREIKEETNLDVHDVRFVLVQDCIHSKEFYRDAHFILLNYTCRCSEAGRVQLNEEAQEFRWLSLSQARQLSLNEPTRILLDALDKEPPKGLC
jgi:phosphoglycolate phosphatase